MSPLSSLDQVKHELLFALKDLGVESLLPFPYRMATPKVSVGSLRLATWEFHHEVCTRMGAWQLDEEDERL